MRKLLFLIVLGILFLALPVTGQENVSNSNTGTFAKFISFQTEDNGLVFINKSEIQSVGIKECWYSTEINVGVWKRTYVFRIEIALKDLSYLLLAFYQDRKGAEEALLKFIQENRLAE